MIHLEYNLDTSIRSARPIFAAYINGRWLTCILDTGANIPVFNMRDDKLKRIFDAKYYKESTINGFGSGVAFTNMYNIPNFELSDGKQSLFYKELKCVAVQREDFPFEVLLSASMFIKMRYSFDYLHLPNKLIIEAERDMYGVGFYRPSDTIYILSSSESKYIKSINSANEPVNVAQLGSTDPLELKPLNAFSEDN